MIQNFYTTSKTGKFLIKCAEFIEASNVIIIHSTTVRHEQYRQGRLGEKQW
jgi:hypothetical protein